MANMTDSSASGAATSVECRSAGDPFVRMLLLGVVLLAWGAWSGYDAFYKLDKQGNRAFSMEKNASHYLFNAGMSMILPPVSLVVLAWAFRIRRRRLLADGEGLGYVGKEKIAWSRLKRLSPGGKGLLDVYYDGPGGNLRRLRLDSWMLKNFNELVAFIEAKAPNVPVEAGKQ
jgi:hypothetical protein